MTLTPRWLAAVAAAATTIVLALVSTQASAATLFSDDFNDGDTDGWSRSGGTWSVSAGAYHQTGTSADAKAQAGSSSWTGVSVQARVRVDAFGGSSSRAAGIVARAQSMSSFYSLVLAPSAVQLRRGSTTLATAPFATNTGTWYTLRLEAFGSTLRGFVDGAELVSASDSGYESGRAGFTAKYAAASFDDFIVGDTPGPGPTPTTASPTPTSSSPTSPPPTSPPPTTPPPTTPPPSADGIVGWATQAGGTTGGAGGPTVTVSSFADFRAQAQAEGARTILVDGMLSGSGTVVFTADKTIRGIGANSGVSGTTLNIEDMHPANVIIQNMNIWGVPGNDAIQIENATHIWIDHNTLSSTIEDDPDFYDGMLDITHAGDYITVSWNVFRNHWKNSLVGHSDGNGGEDRGHLKVTYHHNWFDHTFERSPRVRFGETVHVFNNYYSDIDHTTDSYAIASVMDAGLLVEGNVFENVRQACWSASGLFDSDPGRLAARDNILTNSGPCEINGSVAPLPYSYQADPASQVKATVTAGAGAGRI